ncbi:MAG: hypothetical protein IPO09_14585 [Anaeromyxobacter sp.]|nr:hypothetical protein [Anaeromyxobacter sp.]MBL0275409.1 hypothetical protein [Anaeromyxobacter sp.]
MESKRKGAGRTADVVVTEGAAQAALRRGAAPGLTAEEEKVLRLRLGAALPRTSELEWTERELSEDQQIELQAAQIEAWMKWKDHLARQRAGQPATRTLPAPQPSRVKEKIVRALRKKA